MIVKSWIKCARCGQQCDEYRSNQTGTPKSDGQFWRTVCSQCKRFIGYRPVNLPKKRNLPV